MRTAPGKLVVGVALAMAMGGLAFHLHRPGGGSDAAPIDLHVPPRVELDRVTVPIEFTIRAENRGARRLDVRVVSRTCGCLEPQVRDVALPAGEHADVPMSFRPSGLRGKKVYAVEFLIVDRLPDGGTRLVPGVTSEVHVDARPLLSVEPRVLSAFPPAAGGSRRLAAAVHVPRDAELSGLRWELSPGALRIEPPDGRRFEVVVPWSAFGSGGVHRLHVYARVDGTPVSDTLTVHVRRHESPFHTPGGRIMLGYLRGGRVERSIEVHHAIDSLREEDLEVRLEGVVGQARVERVSSSTIRLRVQLRRESEGRSAVGGALQITSATHEATASIPLVGYWS